MSRMNEGIAVTYDEAMELYAEDIRDLQNKMNTAIDNLEEPMQGVQAV